MIGSREVGDDTTDIRFEGSHKPLLGSIVAYPFVRDCGCGDDYLSHCRDWRWVTRRVLFVRDYSFFAYAGFISFVWAVSCRVWRVGGFRIWPLVAVAAGDGFVWGVFGPAFGRLAASRQVHAGCVQCRFGCVVLIDPLGYVVLGVTLGSIEKWS